MLTQTRHYQHKKKCMYLRHNQTESEHEPGQHRLCSRQDDTQS